ncbi:hypothetical protein BGZ73_002615 [Actinomortierella ambigua]|nr:hypothetical protein BGZ73_002615 [Actinomortierella ambigua]
MYNVTIAPRSGGHSFAGYSIGAEDGVLVIDLDQFQQFSFDHVSEIATIGAGWRLGPMYLKLMDAGNYLVTAGTCPSVGVGGHALGGGLGAVSRKYGMLSQTIVGMTMVDGQGRVRNVDAESDPDLFWALRGAGGGSFGIVTEFRIKAYKAPAVVATLYAKYPGKQHRKLIDAFGRWSKVTPEDMNPQLFVQKNTADLMVTYLGPRKEAELVLEEFYKLAGRPDDEDWQEGSWHDAATRWALFEGGSLSKPFTPDVYFFAAHSLVYRQPMSENEMAILEKYILNTPRLDGSLSDDGALPVVGYALFEAWGGKIDQPVSPSVFDYHQGALYSVQYAYEWYSPDKPPRVGEHRCSGCVEASARFGRDMQAAFSSGPLEAYQNYIEPEIPDALAAYYGAANLPRLKQIKKMVDPNNLFTFPHAIPLP